MNIGVDFNIGDALVLTPDLNMESVLAKMGLPYVLATQTVLPVPPHHAPRSYCELTRQICASGHSGYNSLLPTPSNNCGCTLASNIPYSGEPFARPGMSKLM